jgi:hypothetical protein
MKCACQKTIVMKMLRARKVTATVPETTKMQIEAAARKGGLIGLGRGGDVTIVAKDSSKEKKKIDSRTPDEHVHLVLAVATAVAAAVGHRPVLFHAQ